MKEAEPSESVFCVLYEKCSDSRFYLCRYAADAFVQRGVGKGELAIVTEEPVSLRCTCFACMHSEMTVVKVLRKDLREKGFKIEILQPLLPYLLMDLPRS